jgi:Autographiviridae endonuclease VII
MLKCTTCKKPRPEEDFCLDAPRTCRGGRAYQCRDCANKHARDYRKKHRLRLRRASKIRMRDWRKKHPRRVRLSSRNSSYRRIGLDGEQGYIDLYKKQKGRCRVCNRRMPKFGRYGLQVDHNHTTNTYRGLVCSRCNMLIGYYETAFKLWKKVEDYLHEYEAPSLHK